MTTKILFLSSLLISLYRESVNRGSCIRTDIFVCGNYLADIPIGLADIPIEFIDMPIKIMWFFITGFLFIGYF